MHPTIRRIWWRRFHPLVRLGWIAATSGSRRTVTQTAIGLGMMSAGIYLKRSSKSKLIYTQAIDPGETVRIRVYRGGAALGEAVVRS